LRIKHARDNIIVTSFMSSKITINDRVYGECEIDDDLAVDLINLPEFARLREMDQFGCYKYGFEECDVTRWEHSLGVYYLLRHFSVSREEAIAGLLHDISHMVFSHVIDYMYDDRSAQSTADRGHGEIVGKGNIRGLLDDTGLDWERISNIEQFSLLDKELPDLCCDRLDYFLRDSMCWGEITQKEALGILSHITIFNNTLVVDDPDIARFMSKHSLDMTNKYWNPPYGNYMYERLAEAVKYGVQNQFLSESDFYTTDDEVWNKMKASGDNYILERLSDVENIKKLKICLDKDDYDYHVHGKFRVIDPPVLYQNVLRRATDIFPDLAEQIKKDRAWHDEGFYIKVVRD